MHHDDDVSGGPGSPPRRPHRAPGDFGFPGPVAHAEQPDPRWLALWGASETDGLPHEARVRYRDPETRELRLAVFTVRPEPTPPPVIRTEDSFRTVLLSAREAARHTGGRGSVPTSEQIRALIASATADDEATPETPCSIPIDAVDVPGRRKDFPDCSIVELTWVDGIRVFCVGDVQTIDGLRLRSAATLEAPPPRRPL